MSRVRRGPKRRHRRTKILKLAKGYYGARSRLYKTAKDAVDRSLSFAYRDRRNRKRQFRRLWITRIGIAARIMRQILVDHARRRQARKRGGGQANVTLDVDLAPPGAKRGLEAVELIALHDALNGLAALDARQARVVELRFFGGLTIEETAESLKVL